jgi:hypothetical protein
LTSQRRSLVRKEVALESALWKARAVLQKLTHIEIDIVRTEGSRQRMREILKILRSRVLCFFPLGTPRHLSHLMERNRPWN